MTLFLASPWIAPLAMMGWRASLGAGVGTVAGAICFNKPDGKLADLVADAIQSGQVVLIVTTRQRITLLPQQTVKVDMVAGVAESRSQALDLVDKYRDVHLADRVFDLATTHAWVNLQQINASEADAQLFERLASSVIYLNPVQRAHLPLCAGDR